MEAARAARSEESLQTLMLNQPIIQLRPVFRLPVRSTFPLPLHDVVPTPSPTIAHLPPCLHSSERYVRMGFDEQRAVRRLSGNNRTDSVRGISFSGIEPGRVPPRRKVSPTSSKRAKHESFEIPGTVFLITSEGHVLNLPLPSDSPYDPLNWGRIKTALAMITTGMSAIVGLVLISGASVALESMGKTFGPEDVHPFSLQTTVTAPSIFMGIGALLWVPLSLALGRRPVVLLASIVMLGSCLLAAFTSSFYQLLIALCLAGLAEGNSIGLCFLVIIDLTFIHQRCNAIALFWSLLGALGTGTVAALRLGNNDRVGRQGFYRFWSIYVASALVLVFLFLPETYFKRPALAYNNHIISQSATEYVTVHDCDDNDNYVSIRTKSLPANPERSCLRRLFPGYTVSRSSWGSWKAMANGYPQILLCAINPLIFWVLCLTAMNFGGLLFIASTYGQVMSSAPYDLPPMLIAHMSTAATVGYLIAYPFAGPLVCWVLRHLSRRNKGNREAEHYLFGYVLPVLTGSASTLLYGLAVHFQWDYSLFYIAQGLAFFSFVALAIVNTLWVTEAFPRWAAPALVVVGGGSYMVSVIILFGVPAWVEQQGYLHPGIVLAMGQLLLGAVTLSIAFWGKKMW